MEHENDECSFVNYDLDIENNSDINKPFEITSEEIMANVGKRKRVELDAELM